MKSNELLSQVLEELVKLNVKLEPTRHLPKPALPLTWCPELVYTANAVRGNVVYRCNKNVNHPDAHKTRVNEFDITWYAN